MIFTGGTIGSRAENGYIGLGEAPYELIDRWESSHKGGGDIEICEPYAALSENMTSRHYLRLAECVKSRMQNADAVIITHGTDTLCYTAAFLGFVFADSKIPIILVSSNYPLDDVRANGHRNFAAAMEFARAGIGGVYAVWCAEGKASVHFGTRTLPHMAYSDMLYSVGGAFAEIQNCGTIPNPDFPAARIPDPVFAKKSLPERLGGFGRVFSLPCRPDMRYPELEGSAAVLFESYHSGTMCADMRFARFAKRADELGVPIFLAGAGGREADYESVKRYLSLGVTALPVISPSAAYIKLSLAVSLNEDLKKIMNANCGGEYPPI